MILDDVTSAPTVKYSKAESGKQYELIMIDYDNMINGDDDDQWLLWRIRNIPGDDLKQGDVNSASVDVPYTEDLEERKTNLLYHYLFLIYEVESENSENIDTETRSVNCCPQAGNFFSTENEANETIAEIINDIENFQDSSENIPEKEMEKLDTVKTLFLELQNIMNPSGNRVTTYACTKLFQMREKLEEILDVIQTIVTNSNQNLKKLINSLKTYAIMLQKSIKKEMKKDGCESPKTTSTESSLSSETTTSSDQCSQVSHLKNFFFQ